MRLSYVALFLISVLNTVSLKCQTRVDLRSQTKNVDFSGAATTKPFKSGGTLPSGCTVGEAFFLTTSPAGTNLYGCTSTNTWSLLSGAGGGSVSGGGASMAVQLGDFLPAYGSSTALTIGQNCSIATPCRTGFGSSVFSLTASATATIQSGSGTAYIYVASNGTLTVGSNMSVSCSSACSALAGITSFPTDSIPLGTWTSTNGTWDVSGGADMRTFLSTKVVAAGLGVLASYAGGTTTIGIDQSLVGLRVNSPATSADVCTTGSWATDGAYLYVCTAANTWRRVALSIW